MTTWQWLGLVAFSCWCGAVGMALAICKVAARADQRALLVLDPDPTDTALDADRWLTEWVRSHTN